MVLDSTVVFNEVMYNPLGDTDDSLEFVEFFNQLSVDMDVSNWTIEGGIDFTFPAGTIVPGRGYVVVAANPTALQAASGFAGALGPFSGRLDNDGETLGLFDIDDRRMNSFEYDDHGDFPVGPDGGGPSLAKVDAFGASEDKLNWDVSSTIGGTPGVANTTGSNSPLAINEVPSSLDDNFWVEVANLGGMSVNLQGTVLATTLVATGELGAQYVFPSQVLAAGQRAVVTEAQLGFSVAAGEKLFLYGPGLTTLRDAQVMTEQPRGRSAEFDGRWLYPDLATPGAANSFAFHDEIVINEIMYAHRPFLPTAPGEVFADSDEEWIELYNRGATPVDLGGWTFDDAMRYEFAPGTILNPGEYLVVSNDAAALAAQYPGITIVGDFSGSLANHDDWVRLFDANGNPADDVHYYDGGRWPALADAGGSSLELRDVDADNSKGEAWTASDEASKSQWTTFSFTASGVEPLNCCTSRNEFIFGLLDSGEFLIDDLSVRNSGGQEILQNGNFQSDTVGGLPSSWQQIGNHDTGRIALDPDDPTNKVLHVVAQGAQAHVHDHVKTTVIGSLNTGNYQFSFRAKWLGGSRKINTRLFFTRASHTSVMDAPALNGTPGVANSAAAANVGPTYVAMAHTPISPNASQAATVSVRVDDPDGVASARLWYSLNGGAWSNVAMSAGADNLYTGAIPGQSSGQVVQFYVEGTDGLGATSTYPRDGRDSRALYQVNAGIQVAPVDTVRVIMLSGDHSALIAKQMSNDTFGGTFVRNNTEVFYDVDIRQIGSRYIRPNSGYKISFNPEQLYYGVHDSIRMDVDLIDEYLYAQLISAAGGGKTSFYNEVVHSFSPQYGSRRIVLNLARYENIYLDEQFENGSDGTKFELDDITYPGGGGNSTDVSPQDMFYRGDSGEFYRGHLLIKSNREKDDYEPLVEFTRVLQNTDGLPNDAWNQQLDTVMDVDLWMRHYATQAYLGNWDTYGFGRPKNLRLYIRPDDGKIIPFYWDADRANLTDSLIYNGGASRLDEIRNVPANTRLFWGHMWDLMNRTFNPEYAAHWRTNFASLGITTKDLTARTNQARAQAQSTIPMIAFNITSPNGSVNDVVATISGDGWIDLREIRLAGNNDPLPVKWIDNNSWQVTVPAAFGANTLTLEAYDFQGNLIGSDTTTISSTIESRPLRDSLRITEIHYNPAESGDATEFIELMNIAAEGTPTLNIADARFTNGILFDFTAASITTMAAGERLVLVRDLAAFQAEYGIDVPVAGVYVGSALNNGGEHITLVDENDLPIHDFTYNDNWYPSTDGGGYSLTVIDPLGDLNAWDTKDGWRPSEHLGGSPGADDGGVIPGSIVVNEIVTNGTGGDGDWVELLNRTNDPVDLSYWYLSDDALDPQKYRFPAGTSIAAGGFLVLTQTADFGNAANPASLIQFELNELGGGIHLRSGDDQQMVTSYYTSTAVDGSEPDVSFGRYATSNGFDFTELQSATPGAANDLPAFGPVIINELMYNPVAGGVEFIELRNASASPIDLTGWSFINGIDYTFAAGTTISAGGYVVLIEGADGGDAAAEAAAFRAAHGVPASVGVHVYTQAINGVLDNAGEKLELARPGTLVAASVVVDWARYNDRSPWPTLPDGNGPSLARADASAYTNDPTTWATGNSGGTPGTNNRFFDVTPPTDPTSLVGRVGNGSLAELAWTASADPETGIGHYVVYRDNVAVGTAPIPRFSDTSAFSGGSTVTYEVSAVNGDGAESGRVGVAISIGTQTISFQDGINGYAGTRDSEISEGAPDSNNGLTDQGLEVDGQDPGGNDLSILLQWNNLSLPAGATLAGASITVTSFNAGNQYEFYRLLRGWEEGQVTWNSSRTSQTWATAGAKGAADRGQVVGLFNGQTGVNTTALNAAGVAMVQAWLDDPANKNFGVILADPGTSTDGADLRSREFGTPSERPMLNLSYVAPADPPAPGDLDLNDVVNAGDVDLMQSALAAGVQDAAFDLNDDGQVNFGDLSYLVVEHLGSAVGDANLDGRVDRADAAIVAGNFGAIGSGRWSLGDFNGDTAVGLADLALVQLALGFHAQAPANAPSKASSPMAPAARAADVVLRSPEFVPTRRGTGENAEIRRRRMIVATPRSRPHPRSGKEDAHNNLRATRTDRSPRVSIEENLRERRAGLLDSI
ncbi:MAG: lamin tail domain-containing protein [Pirellulales bacterium]